MELGDITYSVVKEVVDGYGLEERFTKADVAEKLGFSKQHEMSHGAAIMKISPLLKQIQARVNAGLARTNNPADRYLGDYKNGQVYYWLPNE